MSYDRYTRFRNNGEISIVPSVKLSKKSSDYFIEYVRGRTRLDNVSYEYYNDPNYDWLIMLANPEYGSMEFEIPNHTMIRIPYPLAETLEDYKSKIEKHITLYGLK